MKINEIIAKEGANGILPGSKTVDDDEDELEIEDQDNITAEWEYWAGGLSPG